MFPLYLRGTCADVITKALENPSSNLVNLFAPNDWPFSEAMILKVIVVAIVVVSFCCHPFTTRDVFV